MSENIYMCVCFLGTGPSWSREDGLGAVNAADFLDLPADQSAMVENFWRSLLMKEILSN